MGREVWCCLARPIAIHRGAGQPLRTDTGRGENSPKGLGSRDRDLIAIRLAQHVFLDFAHGVAGQPV